MVLRLLVVSFVAVAFTALADPPPLEGTVLERLESGGYSYLRLKTAAGEKWAAVPQVTLEVGAKVTVDAQAEMTNFSSPKLKRTWPVITFGTVRGAPASEPAKSAAPDVANPHEAGLPKTLPATPALEGKVLETLDAATYTYLRLSTKDGETWAAVPKATVAKGATVKVKNPQPMDGFKSPSLNRTFEKIVFGTLEAP